ncbi:MAG: SpoIIIAC/SpoIIIAD family protein, partial [Bacillota bacterium]|nr:SpoIIIAC/SpoIIIAD family protein [Bacillota bacterium]
SIALVGTFFSLFLKNSQIPLVAIMVVLVTSLAIILKILPSLLSIFGKISEVSAGSYLKVDYIPLLLKIVAVAYLGEFAQDICEDAGEKGLGKKLELAIKIIIMVMALPLLEAVVSTVLELLK